MHLYQKNVEMYNKEDNLSFTKWGNAHIQTHRNTQLT